uniref:Variant surface glycoprotein 1125.446 n=1 Tax=Trypanosoma brucei TaxID=5691 RepID=A0A1J0R5Z0_9TRYP|nr:variant surface glycoprotein 1125.446 [Trypanosoma brucei]
MQALRSKGKTAMKSKWTRVEKGSQLVLTVLTVLLIGDVRISLAANEEALKPEAWKGICDIYAYLSSKMQSASTSANTRRTAFKQANLNSLKTAILYHTTPDPEMKAKLSPLVAYTAAKKNEILAAVTAHTASATDKALKDISFFLGRLREYAIIAATDAHASTKGCWSTDGSGSDFHKLADILLAHGNCKEIAKASTGTIDLAGKFTAKGYAGTELPQDPKAGSGGKGCRVHTAKNSEGAAAGTINSAGYRIAGGLLEITATKPTMSALTDIGEQATGRGFEDLKAAWDAGAADFSDKASPTLPILDDLEGRSEVAKAASLCLGLDTKEKRAPTKKQLQAIYGEQDDVLQKTIWDKMKNIQTTTDHGETKKGAKLNEIDDPQLLTEILNNLTAKQAADTVRKSKETPVECVRNTIINQGEGECNKIDEESKYNGEKMCSWQKEVQTGEKNCKYNETKAKEKGVPVAQAEAGGETTTPSDRCTKHNDKVSCEKENKGQKYGENAHCGWVDNTCKDCSYLVNKNFALIFSAFVGIVAF